MAIVASPVFLGNLPQWTIRSKIDYSLFAPISISETAVHFKPTIPLAAGILAILVGCGESVDWQAEAEKVRRAKAAANQQPDYNIDWAERAEKNRVLASREFIVRKHEREVWEAKLREEARLRSIQEMQEAAQREQTEWLANQSPNDETDAPVSIRIARGEVPAEWLEKSLPDLKAQELLVPEVIEIRRREAERIVQETTVSLHKNPDEQKKQRVFDFYEQMGMSEVERQQQAAERAKIRQQAREHGLGEMQEIDAATDLSAVRYLCLSGPRITDESLARLSGNESVKLLHMDQVSVGIAGFKHLKSLPNLRILVIEHMRLSDAVVAGLRRSLPQVAVHYLPPTKVQPNTEPVSKPGKLKDKPAARKPSKPDLAPAKVPAKAAAPKVAQ